MIAIKIISNKNGASIIIAGVKFYRNHLPESVKYGPFYEVL